MISETKSAKSRRQVELLPGRRRGAPPPPCRPDGAPAARREGVGERPRPGLSEHVGQAAGRQPPPVRAVPSLLEGGRPPGHPLPRPAPHGSHFCSAAASIPKSLGDARPCDGCDHPRPVLARDADDAAAGGAGARRSDGGLTVARWVITASDDVAATSSSPRSMGAIVDGHPELAPHRTAVLNARSAPSRGCPGGVPGRLGAMSSRQWDRASGSKSS